MQLRLCTAFVFFFAVGCGAKFAPVTGVVMLNGKPLANAMVTFQPEKGGATDAGGSSGKTNEKGEYSLKGTAGQTGAVVGKHQVSILAADHQPEGDADSRPSNGTPPPKEKVPQIYNSHTTLKATVASSNNKIDFDLTGSGVMPTNKASGGDGRH